MKKLPFVLLLFFNNCVYSQLIKEYNQCAVEALDKGRYDEAINYFTRVIIINPKDSFAYFDRGLAYESQKKHCEAIADFSKAVEIDKGNVDNYFLRGIAYYKMKNFILAMPDFNKTIEIEYDNSDAHYYKARIKIGQGNYPESIKELDLAISITEENAKAYSSRAWAKANLNDYTGAVKDLNRAIAIDSSYPEAYYYRAWIKAEQLSFNQALDDYNKFLNFNSDKEYFDLGVLNHSNNRYKDGLTSYFSNKRIDSLRRTSDFSIGLLMIYFQDYKKAIDDLNSEIIEQPGNSKLYYFKGYAHYKTGDIINALICYNKAIELDPEKPHYYYTRGELLYKTGEKKKGAEDLLKCIQLGGSYSVFNETQCD